MPAEGKLAAELLDAHAAAPNLDAAAVERSTDIAGVLKEREAVAAMAHARRMRQQMYPHMSADLLLKRRPFVTAKRLLTNQTFRDLYRTDTLDVDQRLARWASVEDNAERARGPRRRIYRLTPKGKRKLAESREQFQEFVAVIGGILGATT